MYQSMEGNAAPYEASQEIASATQADLLRTLQTVSDNIMRLAGKLHAGPGAAIDDVANITEQHALAQQLIGRLLVMPASQA